MELKACQDSCSRMEEVEEEGGGGGGGGGLGGQKVHQRHCLERAQPHLKLMLSWRSYVDVALLCELMMCGEAQSML